MFLPKWPARQIPKPARVRPSTMFPTSGPDGNWRRNLHVWRYRSGAARNVSTQPSAAQCADDIRLVVATEIVRDSETLSRALELAYLFLNAVLSCVLRHMSVKGPRREDTRTSGSVTESCRGAHMSGGLSHCRPLIIVDDVPPESIRAAAHDIACRASKVNILAAGTFAIN